MSRWSIWVPSPHWSKESNQVRTLRTTFGLIPTPPPRIEGIISIGRTTFGYYSKFPIPQVDSMSYPEGDRCTPPIYGECGTPIPILLVPPVGRFVGRVPPWWLRMRLCPGVSFLVHGLLANLFHPFNSIESFGCSLYLEVNLVHYNINCIRTCN